MMRIGTGYDMHRLEAGRPLILGGVTIPFEKGLMGHSDADALAHAVIDALLGAAALGNIGQHFPDTDPKWKNADSLKLLRQTVTLLRRSHFDIINIDTTIVAQAPKLNPFLDKMRANLAECLDLNLDRVSVKAKTNENVGPEGRGEAISVQAVALIQSKA
jgi:2-C-methyl-D-erythritol 2,4-cyclodiphosphate synthase